MVLIKETDIRIMNISNHGRLYINDLVLPHSNEICRNEVEPDFITDILANDNMNGLIVLVDYIPVAFIFFKLEDDVVEVKLVGNKNIKALKHFRFGSFLLSCVEKYAIDMYATNLVVHSLPVAVDYYKRNGFKFQKYSDYFIHLTESVIKSTPDTYTLYKELPKKTKFSFFQSENIKEKINNFGICNLLILYLIFGI